MEPLGQAGTTITRVLSVTRSCTRYDSSRVSSDRTGVISALPILSALLFANSILISDLRPCLPNALKKNTSALIYSCLVVPLIPMAFVGTLLGNILFIVYCESTSTSKTDR